MAKKMLIITAGNEAKLLDFKKEAKILGLDVTCASFGDISFDSKKTGADFILKVRGKRVEDFDLIYIRLVGKRLEEATILANYAKDKGIKIVDKIYSNSLLMPVSLAKSLETLLLVKANVSLPKTLFGSLVAIEKKGPKYLGFPYVIKSTSGKKAREVWSPTNTRDLLKLLKSLKSKEEKGMKFFAQEFVKASQRIRVLVLDGKVLAAITQPTKWKMRFSQKEAVRGILKPVPQKISNLTLKAVRAVSLDIAGVDILVDDETNRLYVIEVNAAPSWGLIKKYSGVNIEREILKFLSKL